MEFPRRLSDRVALVTGSSSGIGKGIALRLGREGASVAVNHSRSPDQAEEVAKEIRSLGGRAVVVRADVSRAREVNEMVAAVVGEFGKINILVNNAGILLEKPFGETTEQEWDRIMEVNLKGPYLCCRRCVPEMLKQGSGKIINIASIDSVIAEPNTTAYCASKAGIMGFTTALALEMAPKRINVNAVAPGQIDTPMIAEWMKNPELVKNVISKTPFGRFGRPDDIAAAVAFLASDESEFINGALIPVDGGWMIQ